jgi:histidine triad (HIT) family protein
MSSIFTKIVNDEIPSFKVHEDKYHLAFLDINPLKKGILLLFLKRRQIIFLIFIQKNTKNYGFLLNQ